MDIDVIQNKVLYEKLLKENVNKKWIFLHNNYFSTINDYEKKRIPELNLVKEKIKLKLGFVSPFVFLTNFINDKKLKYNANHMDKALLIIYDFISSVTHRDMAMHMGASTYRDLQYDFFYNYYKQLHQWCDYMLHNEYFSNSNLRIVGKYIDNLPSYLNNVTLFLNIFDSRIDYTKNNNKLKKDGFLTFVLIDINGYILYISESIHSSNLSNEHGLDIIKSKFDNIDFCNFMDEDDCILVHTNLEIIDGYVLKKNNKIIHELETFYFETFSSDVIDKINNYFVFSELLYLSPKLNIKSMRNHDIKEVQEFRIKIVSTLLNIKKISIILELENNNKYQLWKDVSYSFKKSIISNNIIRPSIVHNNLNNIKSKQYNKLKLLKEKVTDIK
jgi:hypothetical protein